MWLLRFVFLLYVCSVCFGQDTYYNNEYGFTIVVPSQWHTSFDKEWSDEVKTKLIELYSSTTLLMLNPLNIKPADAPCIQIQGKMFTSEISPSQAILLIKKTGFKQLPKDANYLAKDILGTKFGRYRQIDQFYNYEDSKNLALTKMLYKKNDANIYFLSARAKFIGYRSMIDLRGYYDGNSPEQFWQTFKGVVDSFRFDKGTLPKQTSEEISYETGQKTFSLISKLITWLLVASIVLWILKKFINRF